MQILFVCVKRGETEREAVSSKGTEEKWQTWMEGRKGAKDNPWETARWTRCPVSALLLLPPCVLCHGYQTGLQMQPVNVFFSGWSEWGTNASQSVSCTINVNCPGMHKHMEGGEPGNTQPPWLSFRARIWRSTASQLTENCPLRREVVRKLLDWRSCVLFWRSLISHVDHYCIALKCLSTVPEKTADFQCPWQFLFGFTRMQQKRHNFSPLLEFYCHILGWSKTKRGKNHSSIK